MYKWRCSSESTQLNVWQWRRGSIDWQAKLCKWRWSIAVLRQPDSGMNDMYRNKCKYWIQMLLSTSVCETGSYDIFYWAKEVCNQQTKICEHCSVALSCDIQVCGFLVANLSVCDILAAEPTWIARNYIFLSRTTWDNFLNLTGGNAILWKQTKKHNRE